MLGYIYNAIAIFKIAIAVLLDLKYIFSHIKTFNSKSKIMFTINNV